MPSDATHTLAPMRLIKPAWRMLAVATLCLLLSACFEHHLFPKAAVQTITISRDGQAQISYSGQFVDLYDPIHQLKTLAMDLLPGEPIPEMPSRDEYTKYMLMAWNAMLSEDLSPGEHLNVQEHTPGHYLVEYQQSLKWEELPLAEVDWTGRRPVTQDMMLFSQPQLSSANRDLIEHAAHPLWQALIDPLNALGPRARGEKESQNRCGADASSRRMCAMLKRVAASLAEQHHSTLIVRTDATMLRHNAHSVQQLADGSREYLWHIRNARTDTPDWQVALEPLPALPSRLLD